MEVVGALLLALAVLWLLLQPWFWILALALAALASFFAMLASIVHFQIFWAVGFFLLTGFCLLCLSGFSGYVLDRRMAAKKNRLKRRLQEWP